MDKNVVVIGGFNRSGKTTLMEVIKHLGYGISKGENIPKPNIKYDYSADIIEKNGNIYNINVDGYGKPSVTPLNNNVKLSIDDIYGNIDFFTYSQLFTISLDELNYIKGNKNKDEKLQSLFLGAGYKEIMCIPKIINSLDKISNSIGKKQGRPNSGMFKKYNVHIKSMIKKRNEALKQVKVYADLKQKLKDTCDKLQDIKCKREQINREIMVMDVLKNNYNDYYDKKAIDEKIKHIFTNENYSDEFIEKINIYNQNYKGIIQKYKIMAINFKNKVSRDINVKDVFLKNKSTIKNYNNKLALISENVKNYYKDIYACNNKMNSILSQIKTTNSNWHSFEDIKNMDIDNITLSSLNENIDEYNHLKSIVNADNNRAQEYFDKMELIKERLSKIKNNSYKLNIKKYFNLSLVFVILGIIISFLNAAIGIILSFGGIGGLIVYNIYKSSLNKGFMNNKYELQKELEEIKQKMNTVKVNIEKNNSKILKIEEYFNNIKGILKINEDISFYAIKDYINCVLNFKRNIVEIENIKTDLLHQKDDLIKQLDGIVDFIRNIKYVEIEKGNLSSYVNEVISEFVDIQNKLVIAEELEDIIDDKEECESKIIELLRSKSTNNDFNKIIEDNNYNIEDILNNELKKIKKYKEYIIEKQRSLEIENRILQIFKTHKIMQAFEIKNEEEISFQILDNYYNKYVSLDDINEEYNQKIAIQSEYESKINELNREIEKLKYNIEKLNSSEIIEETEREINTSRSELMPLAEKYAVYSTASFLLSKVQDSMIDNIKKFAFKDSSKILEYITQGDYKEILPNENLNSVDFKSVLKNGTTNSSVEVLSRGTKEQLFFAVRVGKIKQINALLPVIFDDCFVNFDAMHIVNTIKVIHELSKTNQVFVLTCHPTLVHYISESIGNAQYLKLENGKFKATNAKELQVYLEYNEKF